MRRSQTVLITQESDPLVGSSHILTDTVALSSDLEIDPVIWKSKDCHISYQSIYVAMKCEDESRLHTELSDRVV